MKCKNCKTELEDNQKFCHRCGSNEFEDIENCVSEKNENISQVSEIKEIAENGVANIQTDIQNNTDNTESADNANSAIISPPAPKSITDNKTKLIILISAIIAVLVIIIAVVTIIGLKSSDKPSAAESDVTVTQESEETTKSKDMVPLISLCPTYEEFMDNLSYGVNDLQENVTDDGGHINATFDYCGYIITVFYQKSEPHYINSVLFTSVATGYSDVWFTDSARTAGEVLQVYLDDVPNADSSETIYGEFADTGDAKIESDENQTKISDSYERNGITYSLDYSISAYSACYMQDVSIDESYKIENPNVAEDDTTEEQEEAETLDEESEDESEAESAHNSLADTDEKNTNNQSSSTSANNNLANTTTAKRVSGNSNTANNTTSTTKAGSSNPCANGHNWVAVTKTVHHGEEGHYETVTKYESVQKIKCPCCSSTFDTYASYTTHFQKHINADPNTKFIMDSYGKTTVQEPYTENQWVVDTKAYDEDVVTGYKCSVCGKTQ